MHPSSPNSANETLVSRRNWLVLAASAGASIASQTQAADSDKKPALSLELAAGARVYNIRDYGAKGDGKTVDTTAVQDAVDTCARERGGTVLVPAGDFVIGTVELKSNVRLYLSPQGRLLGTADIKHYSPGKGVPTSNGNVVLLYAASAENITVEGTGTVDGQGAKFYTGRGDNTGPGQKREEGYVDRPHLIIFYRCKNLRVRDTFFTASAYHCMRILECRNVQLEAVRIHNRVNKNNDGFHIVSSEFVHIANCDVACQDDACALFGSNKFVTVTNCTFSTRWSIFRFGGGEAENIVVSNCVIYETYGCAIKIRIGGGSRIENVLFDNIIMRDVTGPISIGLDSTSHRASASGEARAKGVVRNLMFRGIRATVVAEGKTHADLPFPSSFRPGETRTCIVLNGVGEDFLQDITLSDVHITFEGGGTAEEAARLKVPKMAGEYFELGTLPAYGLYARNVRGLTLKNVRFETTKPDLRPALLCDNVADLAATTFSAHGNPEADSVVRFINSKDALLTGCRVLTPAATFLDVRGEDCASITVDGGDVSKAKTPVSFNEDARKDSVRLRI